MKNALLKASLIRSLKKSYHTKDTCNCVYTLATKDQSAYISLTTRKIRWCKVLGLRTGYNQHSILVNFQVLIQ